jgi:hypothetical protein
MAEFQVKVASLILKKAYKASVKENETGVMGKQDKWLIGKSRNIAASCLAD